MTKFIKLTDINGNLIVLNVSSIAAIFPQVNYNGLAGSIIYFANGISPVVTQSTPSSLYEELTSE